MALQVGLAVGLRAHGRATFRAILAAGLERSALMAGLILMDAHGSSGPDVV